MWVEHFASVCRTDRRGSLLAALLLIGGCARISTGTPGGAGANGGHTGVGGRAAGGAGGYATRDAGPGTGGATTVIPSDAAPIDAPSTMTDGPGIVNDAQIAADAQCIPDAGTARPGPFTRRCAAATLKECDSRSDINPQLPNGMYGNGFDDDCDGKVDEGCACDPGHPPGTTKTCWLVSPTQVDPATNRPVGWCTTNSIGTLTCIASNDDVAPPYWDGECRGAQPPFADDVCAPGDFDCDGLDSNSRTYDCRCKVDTQCPTQPIVTTPFPDPNNLTPVDGSSWVQAGLTATNWRWTVTGGDCDNILPRPTFAVYGQKRATKGGPRLSGNMPQTALGPNTNQRGYVIGPAASVGPVIYPAFSLSGDYLVKGEWDDPEGHHSCTVKVQVRSPGLRVELCWNQLPIDVDLHVARLQNPKACTHGWFTTCSSDENRDDCYYNNDACVDGFRTSPSTWGYTRSPDTACHGWGSTRTAPCDNPRLDQDNINCDPNDPDPMNLGPFDSTNPADLLKPKGFCTPENINVDNPKQGDRFVIGAQYYGGNLLLTKPTPRPHVNIYCNGERRLAFGFDPTATPPSMFPVLRESGNDEGGDMWEVAVVETKVTAGMLTDCVITPIQSKVPKANKDGSRNICVDTYPQNDVAKIGSDNWKFTASGGYPADADGFCWH